MKKYLPTLLIIISNYYLVFAQKIEFYKEISGYNQTPARIKFTNSTKISIDKFDNIYIAENNYILKLDSNKKFIDKWINGDTNVAKSSFYSKRFDAIEGICTDKLGNVYIAEPYKHKVQKLSPSGKFLMSINNENLSNFENPFLYVPHKNNDDRTSRDDIKAFKPIDVAVDNLGNIFVVTEFQTIKFDSTGKFIQYFDDSSYKIPSKLKKLHHNEPIIPNRSAIVVDHSNNVYVLYNMYSIILKYDNFGKRNGTIGKGYYETSNLEDGNLLHAKDITVNNNTNEIYVADYENSRVQIFDINGMFKSILGKTKNDLKKIINPHSVAVNSKNHIFTLYDFLEEFNSIGEYISSFGSNGEEPGNLIEPTSFLIDELNHIYIADKFGVQKFDLEGNFVAKILKNKNLNGSSFIINDMALNENGNIILFNTEEDNPYILVSPEGNLIRPFTSYNKELFKDANKVISIKSNYNVDYYILKTKGILTKNNNYFINYPDTTQKNVIVKSIAVDLNNNIYVAFINGSIHKYNSNGKYVMQILSTQNKDSFIKDIAIGKSGLIYILIGDKIEIYNNTGKHLASFGNYGNEPGYLTNPQRICVSKDEKYIYVIEALSERVQIFKYK